MVDAALPREPEHAIPVEGGRVEIGVSALFVGEILSVDKAELIETVSRDLDGFEALFKDFDEQSKNAECMKCMFESGRARLLVALSFAQAQKAA